MIALSVTVTDVNEAPVDIALSEMSVEENLPAGTTIGNLTADDPDARDEFTYSFATGDGDTDNHLFQLVGGTLQTNRVLDFETQSTHTIRVAVRDSGGLGFEKRFEINVTDSNESLPEDVNSDAFVSPIDVLLIVNYLNSGQGNTVSSATRHLDVNKDNFISPIDALIVINYINARANGEGESQVISSAVAEQGDAPPINESLVDFSLFQLFQELKRDRYWLAVRM